MHADAGGHTDQLQVAAEHGNLPRRSREDSEVIFAEAARLGPKVRPEALTKLASLEKERVQRTMAGGDGASSTYGL